jgi:hypothetical protein
MKIKTLTAMIVGTLLVLRAPRPARDDRGLSGSAETAILLAGAVALAVVVVTIITAFVKSKLPK